MNYLEALKNERESVSLDHTKILVENVKKFAKAEEIVGVRCSKFYELFSYWCVENNIEIPHSKHLGLALRLAYGIKSKNTRFNGSVCRIYDISV